MLSGSSIRSLLFILLVILTFGCAKEPEQPKILKSMAKLDQAFVPAFIFVDLSKPREAIIAVNGFRKEWDNFYNKYYELEFKYGVDIVDQFWKEDFDKVKTLVASVEEDVKKEKLRIARQKLNKIRVLLKELRHRNGLSYFLDDMTDFQITLDEIFSVLKREGGLRDRDFVKLDELTKEIRGKWDRLSQTDIDKDTFGFDDKKIEAVKNRISYEVESLDHFSIAVETNEEDRIFQAALELKPNYIVLYKAFGNFKPVFKQVKKEKVF
jgi:hypothetical protein